MVRRLIFGLVLGLIVGVVLAAGLVFASAWARSPTAGASPSPTSRRPRRGRSRE